MRKKHAYQLKLFRNRTTDPDPDLELIDQFIPDRAIDRELGHIVDFETKRGYRPSQCVRVHILHQEKDIRSFNKTVKALKERRAYRKFCRLESKQKVPCAGSLSNFRKKMGSLEQARLIRVFIQQWKEMGLFGDLDIYLGDATDIESPTSTKPVVKFVDASSGAKWTLYNDMEAAWGRRAKKKGKTEFYLGFKKITISLFLPDKNLSLPLASTVVPADHHEVTEIEALISLVKSLGIPVKILVLDLGFFDIVLPEKIWKEQQVAVFTDIKSNTVLPAEVDESLAPVCSAQTPMKWGGFDEKTNNHTYICPLENPGECFHYSACSMEKEIPMSLHPVLFGVIPLHTKLRRKIIETRKYVEGIFGRQKNFTPLGKVTLKGTKNIGFLCIISDALDVIKYFKRKEEKKMKEGRWLRQLARTG